MFRFTIDVAGDVQLDRGITRFGDGVSDYRPIWPLIYGEFQAEVKGQFESQGEQGGQAWAPLSDNPPGRGYASWKQRHYPGQPILVRTGELKASLTDPHAPGAVFEPQPKQMTMGSNVPYAIYHQKGTGKMPARPEIELTEKWKRETMRHIQDFLVMRATELGFRDGMDPRAVQRITAAMAKYPGWQPSYMETSA